VLPLLFAGLPGLREGHPLGLFSDAGPILSPCHCLPPSARPNGGFESGFGDGFAF